MRLGGLNSFVAREGLRRDDGSDSWTLGGNGLAKWWISVLPQRTVNARANLTHYLCDCISSHSGHDWPLPV